MHNTSEHCGQSPSTQGSFILYSAYSKARVISCHMPAHLKFWDHVLFRVVRDALVSEQPASQVLLVVPLKHVLLLHEAEEHHGLVQYRLHFLLCQLDKNNRVRLYPLIKNRLYDLFSPALLKTQKKAETQLFTWKHCVGFFSFWHFLKWGYKFERSRSVTFVIRSKNKSMNAWLVGSPL